MPLSPLLKGAFGGHAAAPRPVGCRLLRLGLWGRLWGPGPALPLVGALPGAPRPERIAPMAGLRGDVVGSRRPQPLGALLR